MLPPGFIASIYLLMIFGFLGIILTYLIGAFLIPVIMTPKNVIKEILGIIDIKTEDRFADLGSGDGRILLAARKAAKAKFLGLEISPILVLLSNFLRLINFGIRSRVYFEVENLFTYDLKDYNKVYCYLSPEYMTALTRKFRKELRKGSKVYSYRYEIEGIKANKIHTLKDGKNLYEYDYLSFHPGKVKHANN